jgi:hypothetical protein
VTGAFCVRTQELPADGGAQPRRGRAELAARVGAKLTRNRARLPVEGSVPAQEPLHLGEVTLLRRSDQPRKHIPLLVRDRAQSIRLSGDLGGRMQVPDLVGDRLLECVENLRFLIDQIRIGERLTDLLLPRAELAAHRIKLRDVARFAQSVCVASATGGNRGNEHACHRQEQHSLPHSPVLAHG